jgi:hypothetical protein
LLDAVGAQLLAIRYAILGAIDAVGAHLLAVDPGRTSLLAFGALLDTLGALRASLLALGALLDTFGALRASLLALGALLDAFGARGLRPGRTATVLDCGRGAILAAAMAARPSGGRN